jgi:hypothetical protein
MNNNNKKQIMVNIKNMLEHQMLVLDKIHESDVLFRKELKKSKEWLRFNELVVLKTWLLNRNAKLNKNTVHEELKGIPV